MIRLSDDKTHFVTDNGQPFFYLADTVWSVFSNARLEEWEEYLHFRRSQRFNALQISVLPILHDASDTYQGRCPFNVRTDGTWDFEQIDESFFDVAEKMVRLAVEYGFLPALVLLWGDYVKDTTFSDRDPSHIIPFDRVVPYIDYVVKRFKTYHPTYLISGDTNFGSDQTVAYYQAALGRVKALDPDALTTLHLQPAAKIPEPLADSPELDYYMYQAGHRLEESHHNYTLAADFLSYPVKRPIVNGEPPYEGHGFGNRYGRFGAFHVRKAFWHSILAGAKAGFTYGAHGVWSWHTRGAGFTSESWSKFPFDWKDALRMPGAADASFSAWLVERYGMQRLLPAEELLQTPYEEIRCAAAGDRSIVVAYVPYGNDIQLALDLSGYDILRIGLVTRNAERPDVDHSPEKTTVRMSDRNEDYLIIATR